MQANSVFGTLVILWLSVLYKSHPDCRLFFHFPLYETHVLYELYVS